MTTQPSLFDQPPRPLGRGHTRADVPFSNPTTSKEAAQSMKDHVSRLENIVLMAIRSRGTRGLICDECEKMTGLDHQTCSARYTALSKPERALIVKSGERRKTRRGRNADVYVTPEFAR